MTQIVSLLWVSKTRFYENPYNATGIIKVAGLEKIPTDICTDSVFGTLKAGNMEILLSMKCSHHKVIVRLAMI